MKTSPTKTLRCEAASGGFSLVETVMALGIMGLAITALLGLIPHGIEMSRKAGHASAEARIIETIATRLGNMPWTSKVGGGTSIDKQDGKRMLFDDQGVQVESNTDYTPAVYVARVVVGGAGAGPQLVGMATAQPLLRYVEVQIAATPDPKFNFDRNPRSYQSMPLILGPFIP